VTNKLSMMHIQIMYTQVLNWKIDVLPNFSGQPVARDQILKSFNRLKGYMVWRVSQKIQPILHVLNRAPYIHSSLFKEMSMFKV